MPASQIVQFRLQDEEHTALTEAAALLQKKPNDFARELVRSRLTEGETMPHQMEVLTTEMAELRRDLAALTKEFRAVAEVLVVTVGTGNHISLEEARSWVRQKMPGGHR